MDNAILRDLARAKAVFQQRTVETILTQRPFQTSVTKQPSPDCVSVEQKERDDG